jgi:excisionase family DNA binding protein
MSTARSDTAAVQGRVVLALPPDLLGEIAAHAAALLANQAQPQAEPWIGVDEAAAHLCCPKSRIYRLTSQSKGGKQSNPLPFAKDGPRLLFRRSDLDAWVARGGG